MPGLIDRCEQRQGLDFRPVSEHGVTFFLGNERRDGTEAVPYSRAGFSRVRE